jgi:polyhydroxyalkanoate synthase subunit PhaC
VPWEAAFESTKIMKGKVRFVLGASGHIAGVINPPAAKKRSHWIDGKPGGSAQAWFDSAKEEPGSWWTDWAAWLKPHAGKLVPAPKGYGDRKHKVIEAAPGRYVKAKA